MRVLYFILVLFASQSVSAQPYFARFYTFPDGFGNVIQDIQLSGDSLLFRMTSADDDPATLETRMVTMHMNSNQFNEEIYLTNVEAGNSMFRDDGFYLLPSEDKDGLRHITLNRLDGNFSFIDSVQLKLAGGPYYYFVSKAILYNDKYIVTGVARNTTGYAFGRTIIFIVNKDLTLYDTRIIEPVRQLIKPRDLAINPVDGRLYLSLVYDNFDPQDSTFVPAPQYQRVVTLDSNFQIETFWDSDDEYVNAILEAAPIAFSETGTMYSFYTYGSFDYVIAVDPSGQEIWKIPLDSFMVVGPTILWLTARPFSIYDLAVASNGDILVAGFVDDTKYNIGRSSFLARLRPDGEIKWSKIYRSNNLFSVQNYGYQSWFERVLELPDGSIVAGGGVMVLDPVLAPDVPPSQEAWLLRADSNGCISPACGYIQDAVQKINYFPIVSPVNEWTVKHHELLGPTSRRKYRFSPDAKFINGNYYYELTYVDNFFGSKSTGQYYREENGIVYTVAGEVVYNLNLGTTDTVPSNQGANQGTRTIVAVGTAVLNDNLPRKTMIVQCATGTTDTVTVVEGIGDLEDFFHSEVQCINPLDGPGDYILCYSVSGEIVYMKPGENCDLSATNLPGKQAVISVYPNPAFDKLFIEFGDAENADQIDCFDALGCRVLNAGALPAGEGLDVSRLPAGFYSGVVHLRGKRLAVFKFVISR